MAKIEDLDIRLVIPALNEEASIADVVAAAPRIYREIIVVDNGSTDRTTERARSAGARVIDEPRRGYGRACKTGIEAAGMCDVIVFMDGDGADAPEQAKDLVSPIASGEADLVIGSRLMGRVEAGALTLPQRIGNRLACRLMKIFWRGDFTDLGPFRAIRRDALERLSMDDEAFGWTVEMQARALKCGLRCVERPVDYRRRIGRSKISGTVKGVVMAGATIMYVLFRERFSFPRRSAETIRPSDQPQSDGVAADCSASPADPATRRSNRAQEAPRFAPAD